MPSSWIVPDWPAPARVRALSTTREGGVSAAPYASCNFGSRTDDASDAVAENRARLRRWAALPAEPSWLWQTHSNVVVAAKDHNGQPEADASIACSEDQVCVVLTADCLPVLITDRDGAGIAAVHCGWRGLAAGILENTVARMALPADQLLAWFGPAIGPDVFEVGPEVRDQFVAGFTESVEAFKLSSSGRWIADIYALARLRLQSVGVSNIYGGGLCTVSDPRHFYSYRRDGATGRMATLIWFSGP